MPYDFKFAGAALSDLYGVTTARPQREVAQYDGTLYELPGRSGSVFVDNKRYKNVIMTREIGFGHRVAAQTADIVEQLINWLAYHPGYQEFEDSDHPGKVTYAVLTNFDKVQTKLRKYHIASLKFSRLPFWYDKSSLRPVELSTAAQMSAGVTLFNPYPIIAQPTIEVILKTTVTPSDYFQIQVGSDILPYTLDRFPIESGNNFRRYIFLDSEAQQTTIAKTESRSDMRYVDADPPLGLPPGDTLIKLYYGGTSVVDSMKITPRWRCL